MNPSEMQKIANWLRVIYRVCIVHLLTSCFCGNRLRFFLWVHRDVLFTIRGKYAKSNLRSVLRTTFIWSVQLMPSVHLWIGCHAMSALAKAKRKKKKIPLLAMSRRHSLLVHTAAESFDVITDVSDHTVPFVSLRGLLALVWCGAPSGCSVAVGGRIGGGAGCAPVAAKAVSDDASSVLHTDGLEEILKVLAVLLWYEGTQTCRGTDWCISAWQQSFQHIMKVDLYIIKRRQQSS